MSRYSSIIIIFLIFASILVSIYFASLWSVTLVSPEFFAILTSITALILSSFQCYSTLIQDAREGDIQALRGLQNFLFLMENKELNDRFHFHKEINECFSDVDKAIPTTSSRFRLPLYWLTVENRDIASVYVFDYLILRTNERKVGNIALDKDLEEDNPNLTSETLRVLRHLKKCGLMIKRIEYVYFGGPIT